MRNALAVRVGGDVVGGRASVAGGRGHSLAVYRGMAEAKNRRVVGINSGN